MKTLNVIELDHLIEAVSFLKGAEFQSVQGLKDLIILKFWEQGPRWLIFSLSENKPFFMAFKNQIGDLTGLDSSLLKKAEKKPLNLFLTTHFKGLCLTEMSRIKKYGRVVRFYFDDSDDLYIEFRAYPGGLNFSVVKESKAVHWAKPMALEEAQGGYKPDLVRSPAVVLEEGLIFLNAKNKKTKLGADERADKTKKARVKIVEGICFLKADNYKRFAEVLESESELPEDLKAVYREKLTRRENIEWAYEQQKLKDVKLERLKKRLSEIDLKKLVEVSKKAEGASKKDLKATRFMQLSEGVKALCGKTARENIDLLRKAKSWHIWMHLKDYPSGHLILDIPKNYIVSEKELEQCGLFLFKVAAPKKLHATDKVKFEVIYTESKFVKPIKGARQGLVQPSRTKARVYEWSKNDQVIY